MQRLVRIAPVLVGVVTVLAACTNEVSSTELARRIAECRPEWQNYQEDIKGQIGAALAAEWEGAPTSVKMAGRTLLVRFAVSGPWASRDVAIPVLLREPTGIVLKNDSALREGGEFVYCFVLPDKVAGALPWVEVQYPHGQRRMVPNP